MITCTGLDEFISKHLDPTDVSDSSRKNCKGKLGGNYGYRKQMENMELIRSRFWKGWKLYVKDPECILAVHQQEDFIIWYTKL